jgi:N-acetylglucosamine-6-sulfatase
VATRRIALAALAAGLLAFAPASNAKRDSAAPARPMNIVFVLTDDQTVESVAKMPFVSAYPNWITFDNAFLNTPMCCPSRATILTGLYSQHTHVENNQDKSNFDDTSTLATWLHAAGYRTGLFGKYHLGTKGHRSPTYIPPGWSDWVSFPDGAYYNYTLNQNGTLVKYGSKPEDYSTDVLAAKALNFLKQADATKPFFLYLATRAPHDSYTPAPRYVGRFKDEPVVHSANFNEPDMSDKPAWWRALTPRKLPDIDNARRKEYASLLAVDDAVKEIFSTLESKGVLDRTVIVFMTDNGVALGEHRWRGKGCAYEPCIDTPFLVSYPGAKSRKVSAIVTNADIAPTFADIAGASTAPVDGHSFLSILTGAVPRNWPEQAPVHFRQDTSQDTPPTFWGVRTLRYKYIRTEPTGELELYDLKTDPAEVQSVAGRPQYAQAQAALARKLSALQAAPPHETQAPQTSIQRRSKLSRSRMRFTFHSSERGSVFQCRRDAQKLWTNCSSPKTYTLRKGRHTFSVRAIDAFENTDRTPARATVVVR